MIIIDETIVAAATPIAAPSALSVIRLSGPESKSILKKLLVKKMTDIKPRHAYFLKLQDEGQLIDEAVVIFFAAPHSFTGEDSVEFYLHGSPYIAQNLIRATLKYGARPAQRGEFTLKAVLHGKMPLIDAERINTLIHAPTAEAEKKALNKDVSIEKALGNIEDDITYLYAYFLQILDYPEEYTDEDEKARQMLISLQTKIRRLEVATTANNYLFNGIKVVIIGQPNVGKSTLLNKILGEEKAIVTEIEGTTRDVVEGQKEIDGILYSFYDTAGIRQTNEAIEKIGIAKSLEAIEKSDIVLLLSDTGHFEENFKCSLANLLKEKKTVKVATKNDLSPSLWNEADVQISSSDEDLSALFSKIESILDLDENHTGGLYTLRDLNLLERLDDLLNRVRQDFAEEHSYDLVAVALQEAHHLIKALTGKEYDPEAIYDEVFSSFCVGK